MAIFGHSFLDFATTILTFFLVNVVIFLSAYVITKVYYTCYSPLEYTDIMLQYILVQIIFSVYHFTILFSNT